MDKDQKFNQTLIDNATRMLQAAGATYVIVCASGDILKHGITEPEAKAKTRPKTRRKYNSPENLAIRNHVRSHVDNLPEGGLIDIPATVCNADVLQARATARAYQLWGTGAYTSHIITNEDGSKSLRMARHYGKTKEEEVELGAESWGTAKTLSDIINRIVR